MERVTRRRITDKRVEVARPRFAEREFMEYWAGIARITPV